MKITVAGAGAGKTTSMASKIIEFRENIEENKMIFCITFTNNAVKCIENKLLEYYSSLPNNIIVSTIHAFLYRGLIKPYYYLLYGKQYEKISVAELPIVSAYKRIKISRLENNLILHQTVIPERAKWVIYKKSNDNANIRKKRKVIKDKLLEYCGAIFVDEAQDIDTDMQLIIEQFDSIGIPVLLMGDPKQDLRGYGCFRKLVENNKENVDYLTICYRCPNNHLLLSNLLVAEDEKQHSNKQGGLISWCFESDKNCGELIEQNDYDLLFISQKHDIYDTHMSVNKKNLVEDLADEIELAMRINHPNCSDLLLKRLSYFYAQELIQNYKQSNNKVTAMNTVFKSDRVGRDFYGQIINTIPENSVFTSNSTIMVNSIESIKGKEGVNCLFILTNDLAAYLFSDIITENKTKNKLYVALTRSLDKLIIFITAEVEKKYGKDNIIQFITTVLPESL